MTLPGGTRFAAATTSGTSAVMSLRPRSFRRTSPPWSRSSMQRKPSHLTSNRYSAELNGASADAACIGRTSSGKLSSSIWSWLASVTSPRLGERDLRDGHATRRLERAAQQVVRLLAELFRLYVVGVVVVEAGLDIVDRHELLDVDGVRGGQGEVVEVLVVDDDVAVFADFVSTLDLAVRDLVVALCAPPLV